jgi:hypothetical protein
MVYALLFDLSTGRKRKIRFSSPRSSNSALLVVQGKDQFLGILPQSLEEASSRRRSTEDNNNN